MLLVSHSHGIITVDTGYIRRGMAASHLIVEKGHAAFVDTGTSLSLPNLLYALEVRGIRREDVDYVIVTHVHLDHAGGAGRLLQELPNARLVAHPRGTRHMIDPSKLIAGSTEVYGPAQMEKLYGEIVPVAADRVLEAPDGFRINLQGRELHCLDTPGHARHHLCVSDPASRSLFTGDAFGISYREFDSLNGAFIFPATTPVQFEPEVMHESIRRLLKENPRQLYLTHYGEVRNPQKLARDLHFLIDTFVALAEDMAHRKNARHALMVEAMTRFLLEQMKEHGCTLNEERCREILHHDMDLNAQGLEVWCDKKAAA